LYRRPLARQRVAIGRPKLTDPECRLARDLTLLLIARCDSVRAVEAQQDLKPSPAVASARVIVESHPSEVLVVAERDQLVALADLIVRDPSGVIELPSATAAVAGGITARAIRIVIAAGPGMSVKWSGDELVLTGDRAALDIFASNIRNLGHGRIGGSHIHIEYFPGHFYLHDDSVPVVVQATDTRVDSRS